MLPNVIQNIIYEYKEEFERVEDQIEECLQKYYDIEEKVDNFKTFITLWVINTDDVHQYFIATAGMVA